MFHTVLCTPVLRPPPISLWLYCFMFTAPKSTHLFTVMEVNLFEKYEAVVQRKLQQLSVHVFIGASTCKQIFLDWTTQLQYCLKFFSYYCGDSISIRENMLTCEKICSLLFFFLRISLTTLRLLCRSSITILYWLLSWSFFMYSFSEGQPYLVLPFLIDLGKQRKDKFTMTGIYLEIKVEQHFWRTHSEHSCMQDCRNAKVLFEFAQLTSMSI